MLSFLFAKTIFTLQKYFRGTSALSEIIYCTDRKKVSCLAPMMGLSNLEEKFEWKKEYSSEKLPIICESGFKLDLI